MNRLVCFGSALILSACITPVFAATPVQFQKVVSYADLNISVLPDAEILLLRIRMAARSVCGNYVDLRDIPRFRFQRTCQQDAMDGAVRDVNSALLAKLHGKPQLYGVGLVKEKE